MPSNFEKRTKKSIEEVTEQIKEKRSELRAQAEPVYTQTALDVYTDDGGKNYYVAEVAYDPATKDAKVIEIYKISRLVALQNNNTKVALNTLKRKLLKKD